MKIFFMIVHIIVAVGLVCLILLQTSKGGLGSAFGGEVYRSKRGAERLVFTMTIVLASLFLLTSIANILVR